MMSHGRGAPDGIGGTVKRTEDSLLLPVNDVASGKTFYDRVGKSLKSIQRFYVKMKK